MIGKVHRIIGTFNPHIGMTLAASLTGGVAYGYKRTSWPEIQKWSKAREFYFLELESQKSFSHLKKMPNLQHFIIEDTDILLPEYETGSFEVFAIEIKSLITNHGMNVYFNSTWKENELTKALQNVGVDVHPWSMSVETNVKNEEIEEISKEEKLVKKIIKDKPVEKKQVEIKKEQKVFKDKHIEKKIWKVKEFHKPKEQIKYQGENKSPTPEDLELFYSQPKTRWQKIRAYFSRTIEKIVNNF